MNKAVFLDRDGVINKAKIINGKPYPPSTLDELIIFSGVKKALRFLRESHFLLICITNQPDVSRKITTQYNVEKLNNKLLIELPLDSIYCCYHDDSDMCDCRKPKPGMIIAIAKNYMLKYFFLFNKKSL
jgi:D-glycero-D-manno-heptose 1,7-bisphosphate phosphatase